MNWLEFDHQGSNNKDKIEDAVVIEETKEDDYLRKKVVDFLKEKKKGLK
jgi:hypothetical protein